MVNKFFGIWGYVRAILILVVVIFLSYLVFFNKAEAFTIDGLEYKGPGSEAERTEKAAREKAERDAYRRDRENAPNRSERQKNSDRKKGDEWERKHKA